MMMTLGFARQTARGNRKGKGLVIEALCDEVERHDDRREQLSMALGLGRGATWETIAEETGRQRALLSSVVEDYESMACVPPMDLACASRADVSGNTYGHGALMRQLSRAWRDLLETSGAPVGGEFTVGPCRAAVESTLRRLRGSP